MDAFAGFAEVVDCNAYPEPAEDDTDTNSKLRGVQCSEIVLI